jgi:CRISPR-associated exonuclease Cas4
MTAILLLSLAVAAVLAALYFDRRGRAGKLPGKVVYDDTVAHAEAALVSHRYRLKGKPDHIICTKDGFVPVEKKSKNWRGEKPLPGDRAQVLAYCLLVEENKGPVCRGLLKYANNEFVIPFGDRQRQEIVGLLAEMNEARSATHVGRSHSRVQKCQRCGMRSACRESLA